MKSALNLLTLVALSTVLFSATAYANEYGSKTAKTEVSEGAKKADKAMKADKTMKAEKAEDADAPKMKKKYSKKRSVSTEDPLAHHYMVHNDMDLWLHRECYNREHAWEYHLRHHSW